MKQTEKSFAVELLLKVNNKFTKFAKITYAKNKEEAVQNVLDEYDASCNDYFSLEGATILRVKELSVSSIITVFGDISIDIRPNINCVAQVIVNGKMMTLPDEFNYFDITSIIIHNTKLPIIATIETKDYKCTIEKELHGYGCYFEIKK